MSFKRYTLLVGASCLVAIAGMALPASVGAAAELGEVPVLGYDLAATQPGEAEQPAPVQVTGTQPAGGEITATQLPDNQVAAGEIATDELECMAKVVHHESRGQPRKGQLAVAQTLVNRMHAGSRFGGTICAVANQPGQYFNTRAYHPARDTDDWQTALAVARETLDGSAENAAPGALFFHAAYRTSSGFFHGRQRVATIGDQIFYR